MADAHGADHWQKQADHFDDMRKKAAAKAADPSSTPEEVAEANKTVTEMEENLARLLSQHGVSPTA